MDYDKITRNVSVPLPVTAFVLWILYLISLACYRLFFSPISKFPGPKLAALSRWYEFYYEVILNGQFTSTFKIYIRNMASFLPGVFAATLDSYMFLGSIIRVTPDELHVMDSDYWEQLYKGRYDKYEWSAKRFGNSGSIFTTSKADRPRIRRAPLNPMFSRKQIVNFQPVIREKLDLMCKKIAEFKDNGRAFPINRPWTALTGDVITEFAFAKS
jgi:hypothetical protein